MTDQPPSNQEYITQIDELRARLEEAEETLRAIQSGEVDALVVAGPGGNQIYTLKGAESTYRVLVEAMNEGALVLTPDGTVMYSNCAFADMVDVPLEQVIGSRIHRFVPDPHLRSVDELLEEAKHSDTKREIELKNESRSMPVPAQVSIGKLSTDAQGMSAVVTDLTEQKQTAAELDKYREHLEDLVEERTEQLQTTMEELATTNEELHVTAEDLTATNDRLQGEIEERKQAEQRLIQSEQRLHTVLDTLPIGVLILDAQGNIVETNGAVEPIFGGTAPLQRPVQDFRRGRSWWAATGSRVGDEDWPSMQALKKGTLVPGQEINILRADGTHGTILNAAAPLKDQKGKITGVVVAVQDITERKQAEEALRETEERFRSVLDNSLDCIYRANLQTGRYEYISPSCAKVVGALPDEFAEENIRTATAMVHPEDMAQAEAIMARAEETGQELVEYRQRTKTGEYRWISNHVRVIKDLAGKPLYRDGSIRDITGQKQATEAIAAAKELLEHQVYLLQRALIPANPPAVEGYPVASAYIPALGGTEIGGDFLDVFLTEDDKMGILIGDVSGKGIEAAALAATTRSTVRAFAYDSSAPGAAMAHANSLLSANRASDMQFVTSFLVILDPVTGEIRYAGAGHPPAIVCKANGQTARLNSTNMPLAVMGGAKFEEGRYNLEPGDRLVLYTDGITEARSDIDFFGEEGVEGLLSACSLVPPEELVEEIVKTATAWAHGKLRDDTAVLVVGRE